MVDGLGRGLSTKELAHELGVTTNTVATLTKRAYRKLGVTNRHDAARVARRQWRKGGMI